MVTVDLFILTLQGRIENTTINTRVSDRRIVLTSINFFIFIDIGRTLESVTTLGSNIKTSTQIEPLLEQVRVGEVGGNTLLTVGQDQTGVWPAPGPRLRQVCLRRGGESPQCLLCTEQFPGEPGPDHWEVREGGKLLF